MKIKILALIFLLAMLCCVLTSCLATEILALFNNVWDLIFDDGDDDGPNIEINFQIPDPERCTTHSIVPLDAIAPTCQTPGVSGGQVCSKCGTVIVAQLELPTIPHTYDGVSDKDCNRCGFVREVKCNHLRTNVVNPKAPTCTTTGRTQGEVCLGCGKIIAGCEVIETVDHTYDDARDDTCNVCSYVRKLACFHDYTKKLSAKSPTCTEVGLTQGRACVHCGEILLPQREIPMTDHHEGDWIVDEAPTESTEGKMHTECNDCKKVIKTGTLDVYDPEADQFASSGFIFELNPDQNSYKLVDVGTCTDAAIVIPKYYNSLPVTIIGSAAFINNSKIVGVTIPEGILKIGDGAFRDCVSLQKVSIPSTVTSIGQYAFYNCALVSLTLPEGLTEIDRYSFYGCDFTALEIPYGVESIGEGAFENCSSICSLSLPSSLEVIGDRAFYNVVNVNSITIPKSVSSIGKNAFNNDVPNDIPKEIVMFNYVKKIGAYAFTTNSTINYKGTKADWNSILVDPRNYQYTIVTLDGTFTD